MVFRDTLLWHCSFLYETNLEYIVNFGQIDLKSSLSNLQSHLVYQVTGQYITPYKIWGQCNNDATFICILMYVLKIKIILFRKKSNSIKYTHVSHNKG